LIVIVIIVTRIVGYVACTLVELEQNCISPFVKLTFFSSEFVEFLIGYSPPLAILGPFSRSGLLTSSARSSFNFLGRHRRRNREKGRMWKEPDEKGASIVHVLNVVEECMRWSRKEGGAHRAAAQAWKEFREGSNQ
jgi:hypothetical protein